jgi:hypothetical protein
MPEPMPAPPSKICGFRVSLRLLRRIDLARGEQHISKWMREAVTRRLEADAGLGPEFAAQLADHNAQLRALGANLNQLARAANERRPVVVDKLLLDSIRDAINASRVLISEVNKRLE